MDPSIRHICVCPLGSSHVACYCLGQPPSDFKHVHAAMMLRSQSLWSDFKPHFIDRQLGGDHLPIKSNELINAMACKSDICETAVDWRFGGHISSAESGQLTILLEGICTLIMVN